jgi:hypothetical protein
VAPPPSKPVYVLEVIQGTKHEVHKFGEGNQEQVTK